jgi:hypothetical protein
MALQIPMIKEFRNLKFLGIVFTARLFARVQRYSYKSPTHSSVPSQLVYRVTD